MNTTTTPNARTTTAPVRLGRLHGCEPDEPDWDNALAGNTWELDAEAGDETSVGDFLAHLEEASCLFDPHRPVQTYDLLAEWDRRGKPASDGPCADLIREAVRRSLAAGFDCYDSDTRTWVFSEEEPCADCSDEQRNGGDRFECDEEAAELVARGDLLNAANLLPTVIPDDRVRQAFGALLDAVEGWGGGETCMACDEAVSEDGSCATEDCVVNEARKVYDSAFPLDQEA